MDLKTKKLLMLKLKVNSGVIITFIKSTKNTDLLIIHSL